MLNEPRLLFELLLIDECRAFKQKQNLNEVENLFFHHRSHRDPPPFTPILLDDSLGTSQEVNLDAILRQEVPPRYDVFQATPQIPVTGTRHEGGKGDRTAGSSSSSGLAVSSVSREGSATAGGEQEDVQLMEVDRSPSQSNLEGSSDMTMTAPSHVLSPPASPLEPSLASATLKLADAPISSRPHIRIDAPTTTAPAGMFLEFSCLYLIAYILSAYPALGHSLKAYQMKARRETLREIKSLR